MILILKRKLTKPGKLKNITTLNLMRIKHSVLGARMQEVYFEAKT